MVDIGQGDSIFLRDWKGRTILIDVGGRVTFKSGEKWQERSQSANADQTLIPYLKSRGVGKIDALGLDSYRPGPYGRYGGGCQTNPS